MKAKTSPTWNSESGRRRQNQRPGAHVPARDGHGSAAHPRRRNRTGQAQRTRPVERTQGALAIASGDSRDHSAWRRSARRASMSVRDILVLPEFVITDEDFPTQTRRAAGQNRRDRKALQKSRSSSARSCRPSRAGMKPKQHRSVALRSGALHGASVAHHPRHPSSAQPSAGALADKLRAAVDELKPLEREIARLQRKIEEPQNGPHTSVPRSAQGTAAVQPADSADRRRMRRQLPRNCAAPCKSSSAASRKPKSPRSS